MSLEAEILNQLNSLIDKKLSNEKLYSKICTLSNINENKRTCDAEPIDGTADILNVRLQSVISNSNGVVSIPVDNSIGIVTFFNDVSGFVSLTSEVGKLQIITDGKIKIEGNNTSLKTDILNELISVLKTAIITTPNGPGSFSPATVAKFTAIDAKINLLFE